MCKYILICLFLILGLVDFGQSDCGCPAFYRNRRAEEKELPKEPEGLPPNFVLPEGVVKVEGDELIRQDVLDARTKSGGRFKAAKGLKYRWTNNLMKYYISPEYSPEQQEKIETAVADITRATGGCIRFQRLPSKLPRGEQYVDVHNEGGCMAETGMNPYNRGQTVSLASNCMKQTTIQHEFIHALGFEHEHNRPDRDAHIEILWDNVKSGMCSQYVKCRECTTQYSDFDIKSIMLYPSTHFQCSDRPTALSKETGKPYGRPPYLSRGDIDKIMRFYECTTTPDYSKADRQLDEDPECGDYIQWGWCDWNTRIQKLCVHGCKYYKEDKNN